MKQYEYKDHLGEDQIRLIELLPGADGDPIRCLLTTETRENIQDAYDAISYVWGDPNQTTDIICCGEILSITTSLAAALKMIRSKGSRISHRLWADAICIRQANNEEKYHQVRMMGQVYSNARRVFAWLGPDADGVAFDCFDLIKKWTLYLDGQLEIYKNRHNIPSFEPPSHLGNDLSIGLKLKSLMSCSWFSRVWVVQEVGLAKECHLLWGDQTMSFAEFIEFASFFDGRSSLTRLMGGHDHGLDFWRLAFQCIYRTYDSPDSWKQSKPLIQSLCQRHATDSGLLLDVLMIGRAFSASDPKDHIYAFSGNSLAISDEGVRLLEPDYGKSMADIYHDLTLLLLESRRESPFVLCFVQHDSAAEITGTNGPSWIPRWNKPEITSIPYLTIGNIGLPFRTGGPAGKLNYQISGGCSNEMLLKIRGIMFDEVVWMSEILECENFSLNPESWDPEIRTAKIPYVEVLWNQLTKLEIQPSSFTTLDSARYYEDFSITFVAGYRGRLTRGSEEHRKYTQKDATKEMKVHKKKFRAYLNAIGELCKLSHLSIPTLSPDKESRDVSIYEVNSRVSHHRRLAMTKSGRFALVPQHSERGDICYAFNGMITPFILRPAAMINSNKGTHYHLVGEAYIHNVMKGQLLDALSEGHVIEEDVVLV